MLTPYFRFAAEPKNKALPLMLFAIFALVLQGCEAYGTASRGDLDEWNSDMEYSAADNKYYHRGKLPTAQEVLFAEQVREAREG